jgi:hypothetical protein
VLDTEELVPVELDTEVFDTEVVAVCFAGYNTVVVECYPFVAFY